MSASLYSFVCAVLVVLPTTICVLAVPVLVGEANKIGKIIYGPATSAVVFKICFLFSCLFFVFAVWDNAHIISASQNVTDLHFQTLDTQTLGVQKAINFQTQNLTVNSSTGNLQIPRLTVLEQLQATEITLLQNQVMWNALVHVDY